jgi:hypothetical protein
MPSITISDLHLTGYALFDDSESFMTDLVDSELDVMGGLAEARSGCYSRFLCCITRAAALEAVAALEVVAALEA